MKSFFVFLLLIVLSFFSVGQNDYSLKLQEAEKLLRDNSPMSARLLVDEIIKEEPTNFRAYLVRGNSYFMMQQFEKAIADFTISKNEDTLRLESLITRGVSYMNLDMRTQCLLDFNEASTLGPNNEVVMQNRALVLYSLSEFSQAKIELNKLLKNKPSWIMAYYIRGLCNYNLGEIENALVDLTISARLGNEEAKLFLNSYSDLNSFPFNVGECLLRDCISPMVIQYKREISKYNDSISIIGNWKMITSLMTWNDENEPNKYNSTILRKEYPENINFEFTFNSDGTGEERGPDGKGTTFKWSIKEFNCLEMIFKNGETIKQLVRFNEEFIEVFQYEMAPSDYYTYEVFKKIN